MKKYILLLTIALQVTYAQAQKIYSSDPYISRLLSSGAIAAVDVETSGGSITITGGNENEARLEVYISGNNSNKLSKAEIDQRLKEYYDLSIDVVNNKLMATAKAKTNNMNWKMSLNISFVVYTPIKVSTVLKTSGGSISLTNITGSQNFATSGGSLSVDRLSGNIKGRTSGGSISLKNTTDNIDLGTSGGSITASDCKGNINLSTSGGSLNLHDLEGAITAYTSGGSINANNIEGELKSYTSGGSIRMKDMMCSLETSTSGGVINISVKQLGKYLTVKNSGGDISIELPAQKGMNLDLAATKINPGTLKNFNGKVTTSQVNGTLNGGGIPVRINAGSGEIDLDFK